MFAMNSPKKYALSFTTGSLFIKESVIFAELYLKLADWQLVRDEARTHNLLQQRTLISARKVSASVIKRLKCLSHDELSYLVDATPLERGYLLWLAACLDYSFIRDFAVEVVNEYFIQLKPQLSYDDFDIFFNQKTLWHDELNHITDSTRLRLRLNLFKMLKESGLLSPQNTLQSVLLSPPLATLLSKRHTSAFEIFPIFHRDIKTWLA